MAITRPKSKEEMQEARNEIIGIIEDAWGLVQKGKYDNFGKALRCYAFNELTPYGFGLEIGRSYYNIWHFNQDLKRLNYNLEVIPERKRSNFPSTLIIKDLNIKDPERSILHRWLKSSNNIKNSNKKRNIDEIDEIVDEIEPTVDLVDSIGEFVQSIGDSVETVEAPKVVNPPEISATHDMQFKKPKTVKTTETKQPTPATIQIQPEKDQVEQLPTHFVLPKDLLNNHKLKSGIFSMFAVPNNYEKIPITEKPHTKFINIPSSPSTRYQFMGIPDTSDQYTQQSKIANKEETSYRNKK